MSLRAWCSSLLGLQARTVISRISHYPLSQLVISVAVITAVVIVARFVWVFPATYLPRWLFPQSEGRTLRRHGSGHFCWPLPASAASFRLRRPSPFRLQLPPESHFLIVT